MECNAKLNKKDHFGNTPLIQACLKGHEETVAVLIEVRQHFTPLSQYMLYCCPCISKGDFSTPPGYVIFYLLLEEVM